MTGRAGPVGNRYTSARPGCDLTQLEKGSVRTPNPTPPACRPQVSPWLQRWCSSAPTPRQPGSRRPPAPTAPPQVNTGPCTGGESGNHVLKLAVTFPISTSLAGGPPRDNGLQEAQCSSRRNRLPRQAAGPCVGTGEPRRCKGRASASDCSR